MNIDIIPKQSTLVIGFSGGPDSVYLIEKLYTLRSTHQIKIVAAHLDHEWRTNSAKDTEWCKKYCEQKNIDFVSAKISEFSFSTPKTGSKEATARLYRRFFLESVAKKYTNNFITLGHHRDDQIETFFIRLARGTTLAGIGCIKAKDGKYIRPLLTTSKKEIVTFLNEKNIEFLVDPTNTDQTILRNHIRAKLIPELQTIDSRFVKNIERTITQLQNSYQAFESITEKIYTEMIENGFIKTKQFLTLPSSIKNEIISKILISTGCKVTQSNNLFNEIVRFLENKKSKEHLLHPTCKIRKNETGFAITNPAQQSTL